MKLLLTAILLGFFVSCSHSAQASALTYDQARMMIRDFEWPNDNCGEPEKFGINASEHRVNRANRHNKKWFDCLAAQKQRDWKAFRHLIDRLEDVGGYWEWEDRSEGTFMYEISDTCEKCDEGLQQLIAEIPVRQESRRKIVQSFNRWVNNRDEDVANAEFWDGINESVDQFGKDMEEMRRQRQEMLNGIIYISPGYY